MYLWVCMGMYVYVQEMEHRGLPTRVPDRAHGWVTTDPNPVGQAPPSSSDMMQLDGHNDEEEEGEVKGE